jgi:hypothetical protein
LNGFSSSIMRPQRGLLDCPRHDIGSERQIDGLDLKLLHRGQRLVRFHLAADEPKNVGSIGDIDQSGVQAGWRGSMREAKQRKAKSDLATVEQVYTKPAALAFSSIDLLHNLLLTT